MSQSKFEIPQVKREARTVCPPIKWDEHDAIALRTYISQNPKFLAYVAAACPPIVCDSMESTALSGARHAGFEALFGILSSMVNEDEAPAEKSPFITDEA